MDAEEQKLKVLKMLEEGIITRSEALDLLELISVENKKEPEKRIPEKEEITISLPEMPFDFFGNGHQHFSASADVSSQEVKVLKLIGKNSKISVRTHKSSNIEIEGRYKSVRNNDPMINFENRNGTYVLNYNYHAIKYIGFDVLIPETLIDNLYIENSNAAIDVTGLLAKQLTIGTKNAPISINYCQSEGIAAGTRNSHIEIRRSQSNRIELSTTNAKINVRETNAKIGDFLTTNAEVLIQNSDINRSIIQTKNAKIWLDLTDLDTSENWEDYEVEGRTTNADIEVLLPETVALPFKINGSTKRGSIQTEERDLIVLARDKGYLHAKASDYDKGDVSLDLNLQTTNGNINVKNSYFYR